MAKLKVFRTAIGFHDAYIAAPSRKAALAAWGAEKDLFAMGAAEIVTDTKLTAAPLASPGDVIRTVRGSLSQHLSAAGKQQPPEPRPRDKPAEGKPAKPAKPRAALPRPSRDKLEDAEQALAKARTEAEAEAKDLARREADLAKERKEMEARQRRAAETLQATVDDARADYDEAMELWRAE